MTLLLTISAESTQGAPPQIVADALPVNARSTSIANGAEIDFLSLALMVITSPPNYQI
jgi:hypothetical protein